MNEALYLFVVFYLGAQPIGLAPAYYEAPLSKAECDARIDTEINKLIRAPQFQHNRVLPVLRCLPFGEKE